MFHARQDYNSRIQDSANIIPADEPVFLLRGQDVHAPQILGVQIPLVHTKDKLCQKHLIPPALEILIILLLRNRTLSRRKCNRRLKK
jgi:hypothetical protein